MQSFHRYASDHENVRNSNVDMNFIKSFQNAHYPSDLPITLSKIMEWLNHDISYVINILGSYNKSDHYHCIIKNGTDASLSKSCLINLLLDLKVDNFTDIINQYFALEEIFWDFQVHLATSQYTDKLNARDEKIQELNDKIKELETKLDKKEYVYVLNFYPYDDGVYKVGRTDNLKQRVNDLETGSPANIIVEYQREVSDYKLFESLAHHLLDKYRISPKKEFFKCDLKVIKFAIDRAIRDVENTKKDMDSII